MKTKNNILYSLLALGMVGGIGTAMGQSTAVTDPVGYHSITIYGAGGAEKRFTPISTALVNKSEFAGCADTVTAGSITVAGSPLTAGAYDDGQYYVSISDGAGAGAWSAITSNTDAAINTADDLTAFAAAGSKFVVRRFTTVSDIFGANNEAGLGEGDSSGNSDNIVIVDSAPGANPATRTVFRSTSALAPGWRDTFFNDVADLPIPPGQGLQILRRGVEDVSFIYAGHVKVEPTIVTIDGNAFNIEQVIAPVGYTLGDSGLEDALDAGGGSGTADNVIIIEPNGDATTTFVSDSALAPGWRDTSFNDVSGKLVPEGTGILVLRRSGDATTWTQPAPTIAP